MKRLQTISLWVFYAAIASWAVYLATSLLPLLPVWLVPVRTIAYLLGIVAAVLALLLVLFGISRDPKDDTKTHSPLAKVMSVLLLSALAVSIGTAVRSLWIAPFDEQYNRFVYENASTATLVVAAVLTFILSAIQRDIYWVGEKTTKFDERQIAHRRAVFEHSYKIGAVVVLVAAFLSRSYFDNVPYFLSIYTLGIPGHIAMPAYVLVVLLFALPLIVATWKKR